MNKIFTFATCLAVAAQLNAQTTIFVKPDGTGTGDSWANACNLENAVQNAASGTKIWVQGGTYQPSKMLTVPISVKIYGGFAGTETALSQRKLSANITIIDGQQKIGSIFRLEKSVEINGFTIQNGNANGNLQKNGGGIWADENCVIANCIITNNSAMLNGGGIYANGKVEIINSTIKENTANGSGNDMFGNCLNVAMYQYPKSTTGCNGDVPKWGNSLGVVTHGNERMVLGNGIVQYWTDAVTATACNKTAFSGGAVGTVNADCRTNPNFPGDLFSWCAVVRFAEQLCPTPWRVPTRGDFINLDIALGGTGKPNSSAGYYQLIRDQYLNSSVWGGFFGGRCNDAGVLSYQNTWGCYWSQTDNTTQYGDRLYLALNTNTSTPGPYGNSSKGQGVSLRCVR